MISKRQLRGLLDRSALATGVTRWCEARMRHGFTALMYHRVLPDEEAFAYPFRSLAMPASAFATQMAWLAEQFTVLTLRECLQRMQTDGVPDKPLVAVTFDDGYIDNATIAAPLLEAAGVRGTFYVTCDFLRTGERLWFDRMALVHQLLPRELIANIVAEIAPEHQPTWNGLASWMQFAKSIEAAERAALLERFGHEVDFAANRETHAPMSLEQLRALHAAGHEIGSHTLSHPLLPACTDEELRRELEESKRELESWLVADVDGIAYPNGDCDARVSQAARAAGYGYGCTTSPGINVPAADPMHLTRLDVTRDRVFDAKGQFDPIAFRSEVCRVRRFMRAS